jgi:hypothetical protein
MPPAESVQKQHVRDAKELDLVEDTILQELRDAIELKQIHGNGEVHRRLVESLHELEAVTAVVAREDLTRLHDTHPQGREQTLHGIHDRRPHRVEPHLGHS